jgi:hypothetical protein
MPDHDVSHGDILRAIGQLEGKLDAIHTAMSNNRTDIIEAFRRLSDVEKRIAQGVVLAIAVSVIVPIVVTMVAPRIEFGAQQLEQQVEQVK